MTVITGSVVFGKDDAGNVKRLGLIDSGLTDQAGNKLWVLGTGSASSVPSTVIAGPGEDHIGSTGGNTKVFPATAFASYTSALTSGAVITDTLELDNAFRVSDGTGLLAALMALAQVLLHGRLTAGHMGRISA